MRTFSITLLAFLSAASCLPSLDRAPDSSIFSLFSFSQAVEATSVSPAITSIKPPPGALLSSQTITIRFNRSMNQATCTFLGTVGAPTVSWSSSSLTDDTVTLTGPWSTGTGRTLLVMNCETTDGNVITTTGRLWDVFDPSTVRYVRAGASALNDGLTGATPMPDLQNAIDQLDALPCATSRACHKRNLLAGRHLHIASKRIALWKLLHRFLDEEPGEFRLGSDTLGLRCG